MSGSNPKRLIGTRKSAVRDKSSPGVRSCARSNRYRQEYEIVENRRLAYKIVARGSGGPNRTPDPNNPALVLQQAVPCGDRQNTLSILLALISYSTTST